MEFPAQKFDIINKLTTIQTLHIPFMIKFRCYSVFFLFHCLYSRLHKQNQRVNKKKKHMHTHKSFKNQPVNLHMFHILKMNRLVIDIQIYQFDNDDDCHDK